MMMKTHAILVVSQRVENIRMIALNIESSKLSNTTVKCGHSDCFTKALKSM